MSSLQQSHSADTFVVKISIPSVIFLIQNQIAQCATAIAILIRISVISIVITSNELVIIINIITVITQLSVSSIIVVIIYTIKIDLARAAVVLVKLQHLVVQMKYLHI